MHYRTNDKEQVTVLVCYKPKKHTDLDYTMIPLHSECQHNQSCAPQGFTKAIALLHLPPLQTVVAL